MPVRVDRDQRRTQIVSVAISELGESGYDKFSLKNIGRRLGGSVTLVTHYFSSRTELFNAILEQEVEEAQQFVEVLRAITDPRERSLTMITYFMPETADQLAWERARVVLSTHTASDAQIRQNFEILDPKMREVVKAGLQGVIPEQEIDNAVDLVRVWSSGLVLLMLEHPQKWDARRKNNALQSLRISLEALGSIENPNY